MKLVIHKILSLSILLLSFFHISGQNIISKNESITSKIPIDYFHQEVFSQDGLYNFTFHSSLLFSPDSNYIFFTTQDTITFKKTIRVVELNIDSIGIPKIADFSGKFSDEVGWFSPDGNRIYFFSNRPVSELDSINNTEGLWVIQRNGLTWGNPLPVTKPSDIKWDDNSFYISAVLPDSEGTYDIYRLDYENGEYTMPKRLSSTINSKSEEYFQCYSEVGKFIIFYRFNKKEKKERGLFVTFKNENEWSIPLNLSEILGLDLGFRAKLSISENRLFILNRKDGIYQINSEFIQGLNNNISRWEYFGQSPPGSSPEIFAPGIISGNGRMHCFPATSNDLKEIYWMEIPPKIMYSKYENGKWTEADIPDFTKNVVCLRPSFSNDSKHLYFASNMSGSFGSLDIWHVQVNDSGYSVPVNLGVPVNTEYFEAQQTFTKNGTIYYTGYVRGKKWNRGILYAEFSNGKYLEPITLPEPINIIDSNSIDYTPFISPNEDFLLFASNRHNPSEESCRIYVSFFEKGKWSSPVNMNSYFNFDKDSRDPYISPDSKYLFFSSDENIYWISSKIIHKIKKELVGKPN